MFNRFSWLKIAGFACILIGCQGKVQSQESSKKPQAGVLEEASSPQTASKGQASTAQAELELTWRQQVLLAAEGIKRKNPSNYRYVWHVKPQRGPGGEPTFPNQVLTNNPDAAVILLARMLVGNEDIRVRKAIAEALPWTSGDWAKGVVELLKVEKSLDVRMNLVESMRHAELPYNLQGLGIGLHDPAVEVQVAAARIVGFTRGGEALADELIAALQSESWTLRAAAAQSIGQLKIKKARPALLKVLEDPHEEVRDRVFWALKNIEGEKTVPLLAPD